MKKINELREMSTDELNSELLDLRKRQFNIRLQKSNDNLPKTHVIPQIRKTIARLKTIMTEKVGGKDGK